MTTEPTACKGQEFFSPDQTERNTGGGDINWEDHGVTAAATTIDTNKEDNALLELGMFIGSGEVHKNQACRGQT